MPHHLLVCCGTCLHCYLDPESVRKVRRSTPSGHCPLALGSRQPGSCGRCLAPWSGRYQVGQTEDHPGCSTAMPVLHNSPPAIAPNPAGRTRPSMEQTSFHSNLDNIDAVIVPGGHSRPVEAAITVTRETLRENVDVRERPTGESVTYQAFLRYEQNSGCGGSP